MASEDRMTELVGEKIIEVARAGEHEADRLAARVLADFGIEKQFVGGGVTGAIVTAIARWPPL
jgi:hypothetical protein